MKLGKLAILGLTLATISASAVAAQNVTITNGNGGTVETSRDCIRADGQAMCERNATATNTNGESASKSRTRITDESGTTVVREGFGGSTMTKQRSVSR